MANERSDSGMGPLVRTEFQAGVGDVVVLLHGYGSNVQDMNGLAKRAALQGTVVGYRAPIIMERGRYAWFPVTFSAAGSKYDNKDVESAAQKVVEMLKRERKPVTLMGFSQGGMLSLYVGLSHPELVKRVVVLSGPGPIPTFGPGDLPEVFMAHGTADLVIPVDRARDVKKALETANVPLTYIELEGLPHGVDDQVVSYLQNWLTKTK